MKRESLRKTNVEYGPVGYLLPFFEFTENCWVFKPFRKNGSILTFSNQDVSFLSRSVFEAVPDVILLESPPLLPAYLSRLVLGRIAGKTEAGKIALESALSISTLEIKAR